MSRLEELTEDFGVTLKHMAEQSYKPMTNGDRIRSMTDEELAELIDSCYGMYSCDFCPNGKNVLDRELCKGELCHRKTGADVILDWLKQPVEE